MLANTIIEIMLLLACGYAIFKSGCHYTIWRIQQDLIALENGELEIDDDEEEPNAMQNAEHMSIIKEGGEFYAYGKGNRFLTQAKDLHALFTNIKNNFPKTTWLISNENDTLSKEEKDAIIPTLSSIFEDSK
jgi:hypothetical protein